MNNKIIQYKLSDILDIKNNFKILPDNLTKEYDNVFNIIKKSNNYKNINKMLNSMIKLKNITEYSDEEKIKMNIIFILNKLSSKNYDLVYNKLLKIDYNINILNCLIDNIYSKSINENKYCENYFNLIVNIINKSNFYIDENINFYKIIVKKCQVTYNKILDDDYCSELENSANNDIEFYFQNKKNLINNVKFIASLIINNLLPNIIRDDIIKDLIKNNDIKIELLCNFIEKFDYDKKKIKNKLLMVYNNNNSRILYLINKLDTSQTQKINCKTVNVTINNKMKLKNLINEFIIHNDLSETIIYLKEFIEGYDNILFVEDFIDILFELDTLKNYELIINLLIQLLKNNYIQLDNKSFENINNNYDDYIIDIPNVKIYYKLIFKKMYSNELISKDNIFKLCNEINLNIEKL